MPSDQQSRRRLKQRWLVLMLVLALAPPETTMS
jgi:hypothetical protein